MWEMHDNAVNTVGECVCKMGDIVQLSAPYIMLRDFLFVTSASVPALQSVGE